MNELFYKFSDADDFANRLFKVVNVNVYIFEICKLADINHAKYIVSLSEDLCVPADSVAKTIKTFRK